MVWQKQISSTSPNTDYMKRNYADDKLIKGDYLANEKNGKDAPRMGSKVKTIASIFQSMTPNSTGNQFKKISESNGTSPVSKANSSPKQTSSPKSNDLLNSRRKTFPSELEIQQQKHLASVKNNLINLNKTRELDNGKENDRNAKKGFPQNDKGLVENRKTRTESRVNRFNNAKAIFEKMESTGGSPKFSNGKVSPPKEQPVSGSKVASKVSNLFNKKNDISTSSVSSAATDSPPNKPTSLISNQFNHEQSVRKDSLPSGGSNSSPLNQQTSSSFSNFSSSAPNQITKPARVARPSVQLAHKSKDELLDKVICELASDSHDITMDFNKLVNNSQNFIFQKNDVNLNELCDTSGISEILDRFENNKYDDVDLMTEEEANKLLCKSLENNSFGSNNNSGPSSPVRQPNKIDSLKSQFESECSKLNGVQQNGNHILPSFLQKKDNGQLSKSDTDAPDYTDDSQPDDQTTTSKSAENEIIIDDIKYYVFDDGNYYFEKETENDDYTELNSNRKVRFDTKKVKVYTTYTWEEYGKNGGRS